MSAADTAVVEQLAGHVLDSDIVEGAILDAVQELRPTNDLLESRRAALQEEIDTLSKQQTRFVAAIAVAGSVEALALELQKSEQRQRHLKEELAKLSGQANVAAFDADQITQDLRDRLADLGGLLRRQIPEARQLLRAILDGRISWNPHKTEGIYEFTG